MGFGKIKYSKLMIRVLITLWIVLIVHSPVDAKFIQLDFAIDVKTRFSDGCHSIQEVANIAREYELDGLVFGDHDRKSLEYGVWPFERILKKKEELPSLLFNSASAYLTEVNLNNEMADELILIPGVESAPFYYWTGSLFDKNLLAHNWGKHILVVGLPSPLDYEQIPTLNSNYSSKYSEKFFPKFIIYILLCLIGVLLFFSKRYPKLSLTMALIAFLLAINNHPFRSSLFDQYNGDPGPMPYQELIDYANSKGALTFWNHLEHPPKKEGEGLSLKMETKPHPEDLFQTSGYVGFQALGKNPISLTQPSKEWDQILNLYLIGKRKWPVWGYGSSDFHCEQDDESKLGEVRTVILVRNKDQASVVDAMRSGRMYSESSLSSKDRLSLDEFILKETNGGQSVTLGDEMVIQDYPEVNIKIRSISGKKENASIELIRDGNIIQKFSSELPVNWKWTDNDIKKSGLHYYRLMVETESKNRLVANPIFIRFKDESTVVAALSEKESADSKVLEFTDAENDKVLQASPDLGSEKESKKSQPPEKAVPASGQINDQDPTNNKTIANDTTHKTPSDNNQIQPTEQKSQKIESLKEEVYLRTRIDNLSLRKGPAMKFAVVTKVKKGKRLLLIEATKKIINKKPWLKVKVDGNIAYVWEGFVEKIPN